MTDLMEWAAGFTVPHRSDGTPKKVRFRAATLPLPAEARTDRIRVAPGGRRPSGDAIVIDAAFVTAEREAYRALGLVLLSYALSEQKEPLRIHLPAADEGGVAQIVLWPDTPSPFELDLGIQLRVTEARYRPRAMKYTDMGEDLHPIDEGDDEDVVGFPREHLPFCMLGTPTSVRGGPPMLAGEPVCLHFAGTGPSLVWLGKLLLDLSLEDSFRDYGRLWLYNAIPAEQLARGSAELVLYVTNPHDGYAPPADTDDASAGASDDARDQDP